MSDAQTEKVANSTTTKTKRHNMRMYDDDYDLLVYWADRYGVDRTEFLVDAMKHYIKWRNQDYDLPTAEIQRLNQMIDAVQNLAVTQEHLITTTVNGFDSILGISRGANYLVEDDDGNL